MSSYTGYFILCVFVLLCFVLFFVFIKKNRACRSVLNFEQSSSHQLAKQSNIESFAKKISMAFHSDSIDDVISYVKEALELQVPINFSFNVHPLSSNDYLSKLKKIADAVESRVMIKSAPASHYFSNDGVKYDSISLTMHS